MSGDYPVKKLPCTVEVALCFFFCRCCFCIAYFFLHILPKRKGFSEGRELCHMGASCWRGCVGSVLLVVLHRLCDTHQHASSHTKPHCDTAAIPAQTHLLTNLATTAYTLHTCVDLSFAPTSCRNLEFSITSQSQTMGNESNHLVKSLESPSV